MLTSPVALILGAGSSFDFGAGDRSPFPLGDDLRLQIAKSLHIESDDWGQQVTRGSRKIHSAFKMVSAAAQDPRIKVGFLVGTGQDMARALPGCESIDDLLERHSSNSLYSTAGKLAIAECILAAERSSPLRQDPNKIAIPTIENYSQHWLSRFLQGITKRCRTPEELASVFSNLKVINFNYDRCFEWFTFLWLRNVYAFDERQAWGVLASMDVIHPYGSLGPLPNGSNSAVPFGTDAEAQDLFEIHSNILTYSESVEEDGRVDKIRALTRDCSKIIFLGFAFHEQNMKLLDFEQTGSPREVYATSVGMPAPKWQSAQHRNLGCVKQSKGTTVVESSSTSCQQLINEYAERWAA